MKEIHLSGRIGAGKVAIVDDDIYEDAIKYSWHVCGHTGYPEKGTHINYIRRRTRLHEFVVGKAPKGFVIDHISRDKLDNQRANLRIVTRQINSNNAPVRNDNKSGYRGVSFVGRKKDKQWRAYFSVMGKQKHLGYFPTPLDAYLVVEKYREEIIYQQCKMLSSLKPNAD